MRECSLLVHPFDFKKKKRQLLGCVGGVFMVLVFPLQAQVSMPGEVAVSAEFPVDPKDSSVLETPSASGHTYC